MLYYTQHPYVLGSPYILQSQYHIARAISEYIGISMQTARAKSYILKQHWKLKFHNAHSIALHKQYLAGHVGIAKHTVALLIAYFIFFNYWSLV